MGAARKKLILPDYARDTTSPHDFVKASKPKERGRMVPLAIAVACCNCHVTGTIMMPLDIDVEKVADKMLGGRIVSGFCENCRQKVEFRPFSPAELERDGLPLIGRYLEIHDANVVQKNAKDAKKFASPADSISKALVRGVRTRVRSVVRNDRVEQLAVQQEE